MTENKCRQCKYFMQHYGLDKGKFFQLNCGHCRFIRAKRRQPENKACESFVKGTPEEEQLVTKEYLTKELLRRVLEMELLPDIN